MQVSKRRGRILFLRVRVLLLERLEVELAASVRVELPLVSLGLFIYHELVPRVFERRNVSTMRSFKSDRAR